MEGKPCAKYAGAVEYSSIFKRLAYVCRSGESDTAGWMVYLFPTTAVTKDHKVGGLKQPTYSLSVLEAWSLTLMFQQAMPSLKPTGETLSFSFLACDRYLTCNRYQAVPHFQKPVFVPPVPSTPCHTQFSLWKRLNLCVHIWSNWKESTIWELSPEANS